MEPGELLFTLATLALLRKRRSPARLTSVALLTVLAKFPVWALFIRPINEQMLDWTEDSFPPNWEELRDRWHRLHLLRFVLSAAGTSALLSGSLADTRLRVGRAGVADRTENQERRHPTIPRYPY
jgi:anthrone oxygenase-like protein